MANINYNKYNKMQKIIRQADYKDKQINNINTYEINNSEKLNNINKNSNINKDIYEQKKKDKEYWGYKGYWKNHYKQKMARYNSEKQRDRQGKLTKEQFMALYYKDLANKKSKIINS